MRAKVVDRLANSVDDPDQIAPVGEVTRSMIWVHAVCPDLSIPKLWIIMVFLPGS